MKKSHWGDKGAAGPDKSSGTIKVEDLMADRVAVLTRHQTVGHARRMMSELGINCLPVNGKEGELVGIITSTDLIDSVMDETLVGKVMTREVQSVARYSSPDLAARLMRKNHIHHLVVTHENRIVGVLSSFDLLRLVEDKRFVMKNRPSTPKKKTWEKRRERKGPG
jgi:CBS domain-containing protein